MAYIYKTVISSVYREWFVAVNQFYYRYNISLKSTDNVVPTTQSLIENEINWNNFVNVKKNVLKTIFQKIMSMLVKLLNNAWQDQGHLRNTQPFKKFIGI